MVELRGETGGAEILRTRPVRVRKHGIGDLERKARVPRYPVRHASIVPSRSKIGKPARTWGRCSRSAIIRPWAWVSRSCAPEASASRSRSPRSPISTSLDRQAFHGGARRAGDDRQLGAHGGQRAPEREAEVRVETHGNLQAADVEMRIEHRVRQPRPVAPDACGHLRPRKPHEGRNEGIHRLEPRHRGKDMRGHAQSGQLLGRRAHRLAQRQRRDGAAHRRNVGQPRAAQRMAAPVLGQMAVEREREIGQDQRMEAEGTDQARDLPRCRRRSCWRRAGGSPAGAAAAPSVTSASMMASTARAQPSSSPPAKSGVAA